MCAYELTERVVLDEIRDIHCNKIDVFAFVCTIGVLCDCNCQKFEYFDIFRNSSFHTKKHGIVLCICSKFEVFNEPCR